jgi:hypothetical protein
MKLAKQLWNDEAGFVLSVELILIATILVIGLLAGLTAVRDSVVSELSDVAGAVQDVNQSYEFWGVTGHSGSTAGSQFLDDTDFADDDDDPTDAIDNCITIDDMQTLEDGSVTAPTGP